MTPYEPTVIISNNMEVIINADDLGISPEVNDAIFELAGQGLITSATIIANGPNVEEVFKRLGEFPNCSFGIHLNVTEFRPISGTEQLEPILDSHGRFDATKIREQPANSMLKDGILREFTAQVEKLKALGLDVSHIDSHFHVHTIPWIFPVLKKLQRRFQIRRVRIRGTFGSPANVRWSRKLLTTAYNFGLRNYYRTTTAEGFLNFETFHDRLMNNNLNYRTVEVMVHPGSRTFNHAKEIEMLKGSWREETPRPLRFIDYRQLG